MGHNESKLTSPLAPAYFPFTEAQFIREHVEDVYLLDYVDGDRFISGGKDRRIVIHSFMSGKTLFLINAHSKPLTCFYPYDGELFVSGSDDSTIKIWNGSNGELLSNITDHHGSVREIASLYERPDLLLSLDSEMSLLFFQPTFEPNNVNVMCKIQLTKISSASTFLSCPDGKIVVLSNNDNNFYVFDIRASPAYKSFKEKLPNMDPFFNNHTPVLDFFKKGETLQRGGIVSLCMVGPDHFACGMGNGSVCVFHNRSYQQMYKLTVHELIADIQQRVGSQSTVAVPSTPSGGKKGDARERDKDSGKDKDCDADLASTFSSNNEVKHIFPINEFFFVVTTGFFFVVVSATGERLACSESHGSPITAVCALCDGDYIITGTQDCRVHIYETMLAAYKQQKLMQAQQQQAPAPQQGKGGSGMAGSAAGTGTGIPIETGIRTGIGVGIGEKGGLGSGGKKEDKEKEKKEKERKEKEEKERKEKEEKERKKREKEEKERKEKEEKERKEREKANEKKKGKDADRADAGVCVRDSVCMSLVYVSPLHKDPIRALLPFTTGFAAADADGDIVLYKVDPLLFVNYDRMNQNNKIYQDTEEEHRKRNEKLLSGEKKTSSTATRI